MLENLTPDEKLPKPFISAKVDLTEYPKMWLHIHWLMDSETWAKCRVSPFAAFACINLWCKSWHQVPAGSLPNNDETLEGWANVKDWESVREIALRNWIECSDGKLYHKIICELAKDAWSTKQNAKKGANSRWKHKKTGNASHMHRMSIAHAKEKEKEKDISKKKEPSLRSGKKPKIKDSETLESYIDDPLPNQLSFHGQDAAGRGVSKKSRKSGSARRTQFPADWGLSDNLRSYAAIRGWGPDRIDLEFEAFRNHHQAYGSLMVRWDSAWRTWVNKGLGFEKQRKSNGSAQPRDREDETRRRRAGIVEALAGRLESADGGAGDDQGIEGGYPPGDREP